MSLRASDQRVKTALKNHVLNNFLPENYDPEKPENSPEKNLFDQINYMRFHGETLYQTATRYVEGGSLLVYYAEQRLFLATIKEQTEDEANRYSDQMVFDTYVHLCARTIANLYNEYVNSLESDGK